MHTESFFSRNKPPATSWNGTWRSTYLNIPPGYTKSIDCTGLFSDTLHRPYLCTHTPLAPFVDNIPPSNQIARLSDLTPEDFSADWTDKPFVLTSPVRSWPLFKTWSVKHLLEKYAATSFRAEAVDWPFSSYVSYMNATTDESPLYLFDRSFVEKMDLTVGRGAGGDYWPPDCFGEDLFALLGPQRPDSRWLIIGPERSGSTFHKDPNATSAWNAVVRGAKYWIMFPSSSAYPPPPGVFVSEDQSEVTSPLSIAEWLLGFHAEARKTKGCMEGICGEGEVLHVPSGWWHLVVNLEPSIAITQNFIPRSHLTNAMDFLKNKREQISGFKADVTNPYGTFVERLRAEHPDLLKEALNAMEETSKGKKRKWDDVVKGGELEDGRHSGFSFGFGGNDDDDDIEVP